MARSPFLYKRKKECRFCVDKVQWIDYKDVDILSRYIPQRGKVLPRRITGTCATHQKSLMRAIARARMMALLPFTHD